MFERFVSFGPYGQWVAAIVATASLVVSAQVCSWPNAAFPKMSDGSAGFDMTDSEKSWVASLPNVGAVISPIPCSYIIDRIGRKTTLACSLSFVIVSWLILAFSQNVTLILLARLLMGFWNGAEFVTVSIYVAEVVDPRVRASLITVTGMMFYNGALSVSLISYASYQTMTLLCLVAPLLLFICFLFVPESPYFYLKHGKREEAERAIVWLTGECHPKELDRMEEAVKDQLQKEGSFMEIINKPANRKGFFLVECFKFCSASSVTLLLFPYSTELLPHGWLSPQESHIVLCAAWVVSALVASVLMYRFKRRSLLTVSTIGSLAMLILLSVWYYLRDFSSIDTTPTTDLPLIFIIVTVFFETVGIINIPNIIKGEVFPINIKTKASALSCMTACGFETLHYLFFFDINNYIGVYFNFIKSALSALFCLIIVRFFLIETKGRTLEEIQDLFNGKKSQQSSKHVEATQNQNAHNYPNEAQISV